MLVETLGPGDIEVNKMDSFCSHGNWMLMEVKMEDKQIGNAFIIRWVTIREYEQR